MKVNLVVASGVHQGRIIPIPGAQFLVGRDPHCQLRPASPAISKQHAAILIREGKVFVKDFGSTNGTFVNDEALEPESEREVQVGDRVKMGPLDFSIQILLPKTSDSTPLPDTLKPLSSDAAAKLASAAGQKAPAAKKPEAIPGAKAGDDEDAAALLLGMGEDDDGEGGDRIPEGSTVMDIPSPTAAAGTTDAKGKKGTPSKEDTSNAANEILRKYMRRPK